MHHGRAELPIVIFILSCAKTGLRERERERDGNGDREHTSRDDVGQWTEKELTPKMQQTINKKQETSN